MSQCDAILDQGIRDKEAVTSIEDIRSFLQEALSWDYETFKAKRSDAYASGSLESKTFGYGILEMFGISAEGANAEQDFNRLKAEYASAGQSFFSKSTMQAIYREITNESVVNAWLKCVNNQDGVLAYYSGDPFDRYTVILSYKADEVTDQALTVTSISHPYSTPVAGQGLVVGAILQPFAALSQTFQRTDYTKPGSIIVTFNNAKEVVVDLPYGTNPGDPINWKGIKWSYSTENDALKTSGFFELTSTGNVISGRRVKQTHNGGAITPETHYVEGFYLEKTLKMYRVIEPNVVQFYELQRQNKNEFAGTYWNIGANNDKGRITMKKGS